MTITREGEPAEVLALAIDDTRRVVGGRRPARGGRRRLREGRVRAAGRAARSGAAVRDPGPAHAVARAARADDRPTSSGIDDRSGSIRSLGWCGAARSVRGASLGGTLNWSLAVFVRATGESARSRPVSSFGLTARRTRGAHSGRPSRATATCRRDAAIVDRERRRAVRHRRRRAARRVVRTRA